MSAHELDLVLPAHDEAERIAEVVAEWESALGALGVDYRLRVYDDGSRDETPAILAREASRRPRLIVVTQPNRGHGPTLLRGYREAGAPWIFQSDGDGEIPAEAFAELWRRREGRDLVLGVRQGRPQSAVRRAVSAAARAAVRALAGRAAGDVNVPFRLLRREPLRALLAALPAELFAPNVAITALALARGLAVEQVPVPFVPRRRGPGTLSPRRLLGGSARALVETVALLHEDGGGA